jgi:hypothetical protein
MHPVPLSPQIEKIDAPLIYINALAMQEEIDRRNNAKSGEEFA